MSMSKERLLMLALSTAGFGLSTMFRKLAVDEIHPLRYQYIASIIYCVLIPIFWYLNVSYGSQELTTKGVSYTLISTCLHIVAAVLFGLVLRSGNDTGMVTALVSASPVITLMLSFALLGEQPTMQGMLGMALVLVGIVLIGS